jgi:hypothetical protein
VVSRLELKATIARLLKIMLKEPPAEPAPLPAPAMPADQRPPA